MSQDEQKQFDQLRDQLTCANQKIDESRRLFRSAISESHTEARLYRGLFWSMLGLMAIVAVIRTLRS